MIIVLHYLAPFVSDWRHFDLLGINLATSYVDFYMKFHLQKR
jgi:hypothetical protein